MLHRGFGLLGHRRRAVLVTLTVLLGVLVALAAVAWTTHPAGINLPGVGLASPGGPAVADSGPRVTPCGVHLCRYGKHWFLYGATVYDPGLTEPPLSGIDNPAGTIALARAAHLNTIRLVNYLPDVGDPAAVPFDEVQWVRVDRMIAAAAGAGMTVALDLSDYRNILWNDCVNPYTADWARLVSFIANRRNTITGKRYATDPTISLVSLAGEPLPVGTHTFTATTTGAACTISYSTGDLTNFYRRTLAEWTRAAGAVPVTTGGLGYLDFDSGIDWRGIFALHDDAVCEIKTYAGMLHYAPTVAAYCARIHKPTVDEEFGWPQSAGDAARAGLFDGTMNKLRSAGIVGAAFWNLGYQVAGTSYEVNPQTPLTFGAVQRNAPSG